MKKFFGFLKRILGFKKKEKKKSDASIYPMF